MNTNNPDPRKENHKISNKLIRQRSHSNPENEYPIRAQTIKEENLANLKNSLPFRQFLENNREEIKENNQQRLETGDDRDDQDKIEIRCLYEDLKNLQPKVSKKNPLKGLPTHFPQENQIKGFFQCYKEFPWNLDNLQENMQTGFRNETRNHLEALYRLRKSPKPPVRNVLPNEPFMKLTVLRTSFEKNFVMEYFVTPRGMVNSNRNTDHDDIMIGRQQATQEGIVPNDICLFYSDRAISRVHSKLITKYGFNTPRETPENFLSFLMMSHQRLGAKSPGYQLPGGLYRHIFSFIKEPKKFWLVDLGSSFGTYVKLKPDAFHPLERGQTYLVGLDTYFNIIDVKNSQIKEDRTSASEHTQEEVKSFREDDEFMKFLFQERVYNKCEIHGLTEREEEMLELKISSHKELLYGEDTNFIETDRSPPCFKRPYLKIEVQNYGGLHSTPNHLLIGNPKKEFTVGRMQECDINLAHNTAISRKQCRFVCKDGIWYISDGTASKRSANGTWLSLTDYRLKREKAESEPKEIDNGTEIKINDTVIQVNKLIENVIKVK